MALQIIGKKVVEKAPRTPKENEVIEVPKTTIGMLFDQANASWVECLQLYRIGEDGVFIAQKKFIFYSDDEYNNWVLNHGPDNDLVDPMNNRYVMLRTWMRKK